MLCVIGPAGSLALLLAGAAGLPSAAAAAEAAALAAASSCSPNARHLESRVGSGASRWMTWVGKRSGKGMSLLGRSGFRGAFPPCRSVAFTGAMLFRSLLVVQSHKWERLQSRSQTSKLQVQKLRSGIGSATSFLRCRATAWVCATSWQECWRSMASMKHTLWTAGTRGSILVQQHLGVRLGRLALDCRRRRSSSDASLSIPQSLQSLPLFKPAMESDDFDPEDSSAKTVRGNVLALCAVIYFGLVATTCSLSKG